MSYDVQKPSLPESIKRLAVPPLQKEDGFGTNFSRFLSQAYTMVGTSNINFQTGKADFYFFPLALNIEGLTDAVNKIAGEIGAIFVIASSEVGNSEAVMRKRAEITACTSRIDEEQYSLAVQQRRSELLVWNHAKQELQVTNDLTRFRPIVAGQVGQLTSSGPTST